MSTSTADLLTNADAIEKRVSDQLDGKQALELNQLRRAQKSESRDIMIQMCPGELFDGPEWTDDVLATTEADLDGIVC